MQFRAVMDSDDLARNWRGDLPEDTLQEQIALRWAQGLVFIYPIWWFGPPAILKGWIDRVFTRKFAFEFTATGGMRGLLTQERALIINTLGGDEALYQRERWHELLVRPMTDGILGACGVRNVIHRAFYEVPTVTPVSYTHLDVYKRQIKNKRVRGESSIFRGSGWVSRSSMPTGIQAHSLQLAWILLGRKSTPTE